MKTSLLNLLAFAACLTLTGCPDPVCFNPDPSYTFAVTAHFTPEQDSIKLGDTLYLVSEFPSTMVPVDGQEPVNYTYSTGIGNKLGIVELADGSLKSQDAVIYFDYFSLEGAIFNSKEIPSPERFQQLRYEEGNGKYQLKVGLIPNKKGIYLFGIGSGLSNGRTVKDKCTKATFSTSLSNSNQNLHYYERWKGIPLEPSAVPLSFLIKVY